MGVSNRRWSLRVPCLTAWNPVMFEATGLSDRVHCSAFGLNTPAEGAGIDHENDQVS